MAACRLVRFGDRSRSAGAYGTATAAKARRRLRARHAASAHAADRSRRRWCPSIGIPRRPRWTWPTRRPRVRRVPRRPLRSSPSCQFSVPRSQSVYFCRPYGLWPTASGLLWKFLPDFWFLHNIRVATNVYKKWVGPPAAAAATRCWGERTRLHQAPLFETMNHGGHRDPSAACGRNQNLFSRQDAKNAKKTRMKTRLNLGDLGVLARDIIRYSSMTYAVYLRKSSRENKILTSSSW